MKSDSYKDSNCCVGMACILLDCHDDEPCWGQVGVVDEELTYCDDGEILDHTWIHACEGHADWLGKYKPEVK